MAQRNLSKIIMSRRRAAEKRTILPDHKFKDIVLAKFMNRIMLDGKKSISEKIVEITDVGFNNIIEFDCEKCSSKSSTPIVFDPTLFFA